MILYLIYTDLISSLLDPRLVDPGLTLVHTTQRVWTPAFSNRRTNQMQPRVTIMTGGLKKLIAIVAKKKQVQTVA